MAGRRRRGDRVPLNAEINVVNLIDVMLLLMVIFMLTAPMMQGGVDVALPKADAAPLEAKRGMIVTLTADGGILVDDTRLTMGEFRGSFAALAVAIPAVFGYNALAGRLNRVSGELDGFGSELVALLVREERI